MKFFKLPILLFIFVSIISCSEDNSPSFDLSTANLEGVHDLTAFDEEFVSKAIINDVEIEVNKITSVGDRFDEVELTFSGNRYTLTGSYLIDTLTEEFGSDELVEGFDIITLDETGSFSLNTSAQTITFNGSEINGTYDITTFNSERIVLTQEIVEDTDQTVDTRNSTFTFVRQ